MIKFKAIIKKFAKNGEKTGWSFIEIEAELAEKLAPGVKKSFRVKGKLDKYTFSGVSLLPMGEGNFIMPMNADIRKGTRKSAGAELEVTMSLDKEEFKMNQDFIACLEDEPAAMKFFKTLTGSHQRYFSKWIDSAKTEETKVKRITISVKALSMKQGYSEMIRANKKK